ncbi:hypothetical protein F5050DRAFT_1812482 [Lentinula boryana]|uniref:CCHC-type domain-containing protein n=1 Tax=Lentinula boryana TaxID=40481 RepID=A0ABQ8PYY2_9AGAR|nr:hypothetical protein F5050DRAFT_1812482 [Lentinula boryana]
MVKSALPSSSSNPVPNALATSCSSTSGIICDNCKCMGHIKKNCWAKGGGSEGKSPRWYNTPKGMEPNPKSISTASVVDKDSLFTAGATIYDFSDYNFGDWEHKEISPF